MECNHRMSDIQQFSIGENKKLGKNIIPSCTMCNSLFKFSGVHKIDVSKRVMYIDVYACHCGRVANFEHYQSGDEDLLYEDEDWD